MLVELWTRDVRNLQETRIRFGNELNLIVGANGSGKTSLLEACHVLALGRSFRTHRLARVARSGFGAFSVAGELWDSIHGRSWAGVEWKGQRRSRLNGQWLEGHWEIARRMPLLSVHAGSFELLAGAPEERRRLLDWGSFYLHADFVQQWMTWRRAHEQRNAALRQQDTRTAARFEAIAADAGTRLTEMRAAVVAQLRHHLADAASCGLRQGLAGAIELTFRQGWPENETLSDAYARSRSSDLERGFGQSGPQKADLEIRVGGRLIREASRGEQKRVLNVLVIAQGLLLVGIGPGGAAPLLLLDDAVAEMDEAGLGGLMDAIAVLQWQCLATTVDLKWALRTASRYRGAEMFHVKQGTLLRSHVPGD
ncbi:DNA recombination and repair protein RecF [Thioalkalivibrio nitratireducens DSM 14787]|uniref:DNA replication and repair protein RecF n=1 Tax=Thioalkalivibrio nitratireducens (strain DSM 14787 / UNIQEM 213 / ALEN2) TaxID=1255043 RepID=L0E0T7_THIND|nr:DNA replication and repair protein RecF [Thioalkalivibrio nitratireducens]AGA35439.1 DNA recombination and repair protein RecF [Thioalkalivibrio nitratireducens DSM 14787]